MNFPNLASIESEKTNEPILRKTLNPLTVNVPHIETSQLICSENQLTGFYVRGTTVKGLTNRRMDEQTLVNL